MEPTNEHRSVRRLLLLPLVIVGVTLLWMGGALLALPSGPRRVQHTVMAGRYYYWQLEDGPIAGGGSEERVGFEPGVRSDTIEDIRAEMGALFPALKNQPTEVAWFGFRPYCDDQKPVIGAVDARRGSP